MPRDVNPFEPWRPAGSPRPEPPPAPACFETPRFIPESVEHKPRGLKPREWCTLALLAALIVLGLTAYVMLPDGHILRIICALLPLGLGLSLGIAVARKWSFRLASGVVGLALATLAWYFVPTADGLNLWSAYREPDRLVDRLDSLAPDDLAGYKQVRSAHERLHGQFPELALGEPDRRIEEAVRAWSDRAGEAATAQVDAVPACDHTGYNAERSARRDLVREFPALKARIENAERAWLERTYKNVPPGDFRAVRMARSSARDGAGWAAKVHTWETEWAGRTVEAALKRLNPLMQAEHAQASAQLRQLTRGLEALGDYPPAHQRLLAARGQVVRSKQEAAKKEFQALVLVDRFQAAADAARRLEEEWREEARVVGMADDLLKLRDGYAFLADLARKAGKPDPN